MDVVWNDDTGQPMVNFEWEPGQLQVPFDGDGDGVSLDLLDSRHDDEEPDGLAAPCQEVTVSLSALPALLALLATDLPAVEEFVKHVCAGHKHAALEQWRALVSLGAALDAASSCGFFPEAGVLRAAIATHPEASVCLGPMQFAWAVEGNDAFDIAMALRRPVVGTLLLAHVHACLWAEGLFPSASLCASKVLSLEDVPVVCAAAASTASEDFVAAGKVYVTSFFVDTTDREACALAVRSITGAIKAFQARTWPGKARRHPVHVLMDPVVEDRPWHGNWEALGAVLDVYHEQLIAELKLNSVRASTVCGPKLVLVSKCRAGHRLACQIASDAQTLHACSLAPHVTNNVLAAFVWTAPKQ
jgi:hypothetical protein